MWLDVTTTAIPRLCTKACIGSFLKAVDVRPYKLRWIFHLDRYPGLEQYFEANKAQAEELAEQFDDFVLLEADTQRGYSDSLREVWSRTKNHVLHIEDDWIWDRPVRMADVMAVAKDGYAFMHRRARAGVTGPSLWKRHMIEAVLAAWPANRPVTENWLRIFCHYRMLFRNSSEWAGGVVRPCKDVGRRVMKHFGYQQNAESLNLVQYRPLSPDNLQATSDAIWTPRAMTPQPSPMLTRFGEPTSLENVYLNGSVFLVLSGPSLLTNDLTLLQQRGICTMAVNNAGCVVRPNIWTFGDSTCKFHEALFRDPAILKILPKPRMGDRIRSKQGDQFIQTDDAVVKMPGVVCIERNNDFKPDEWLYEKSINWGSGKEWSAKTGYPRVLSTMIQAVRICYYLGFRKVFLLGCDFKMTPESVYAFKQFKHAGGCTGNNASYASIEWIFHQLRPYFKEAGFEVFNCNPNTYMTAFPVLPYQEALDMALQNFPKEVDTYGWYDSKDGARQDDNPLKED